MIARGAVNARLEAILKLRVRGLDGTEAEIEAVVDTGYTGTLTLPAAVVASLGLTRRSGGRAILADGSSRRFNMFAAEIEWGGSWRGVVASAIGDEPLVGMGLLADHELRVKVVTDGEVLVLPLSAEDTGEPGATG